MPPKEEAYFKMFGPVGLQTPKMKDDSSRLVCDFPSFLNVYLFSEVLRGALAISNSYWKKLEQYNFNQPIDSASVFVQRNNILICNIHDMSPYLVDFSFSVLLKAAIADTI